MARDLDKPYRVRTQNDRIWTGLILVIVGGALLVQRSGVDLPDWLFTWPMILILIGLISGVKHGFRNPSWLIFVAVGVFFLADDIITDLNLKPYFWPIVIIGVGLLFILRPRRKFSCTRQETTWSDHGAADFSPVDPTQPGTVHTEEFLDSVSIFGGVKKVVTTKNFKGGDIVCFMGGAEINLSQADIQGPVTIDIFQAFGGTKLVVPPHWEVKSEAIAIFAGIEDKRPPQPGRFDPSKVLILKGTTVFGGIEIKSY
jgi:predicted membrane protein